MRDVIGGRIVCSSAFHTRIVKLLPEIARCQCRPARRRHQSRHRLLGWRVAAPNVAPWPQLARKQPTDSSELARRIALPYTVNSWFYVVSTQHRESSLCFSVSAFAFCLEKMILRLRCSHCISLTWAEGVAMAFRRNLLSLFDISVWA